MMKNTNFLFILVILTALISCNKENDDDLTFTNVLTSQLWVKSVWGVKPGTDPNATNVTFENYMTACDSNILLSFKENGVFEQYISYECNGFNGLGRQDRWEINAEQNSIRLFTSTIVDSYSYKVNRFTKDEIELYIEGIAIESGDTHVTILKLVPFK
jgi:hypothetical protein